MRHVWIQGLIQDVSAVARCGATLQEHFTFQETPGVECIPLKLVERTGDALFRVDLVEGVKVSTWQSAGICKYSAVPRDAYLLTISMLGLIRYCAMHRNPLLRDEDFLHTRPGWCLCAQRLFVEEYALRFENPRVCGPCWHFLRELCPEEEVKAVQQVVRYTAALIDSKPCEQAAGQ